MRPNARQLTAHTVGGPVGPVSAAAPRAAAPHPAALAHYDVRDGGTWRYVHRDGDGMVQSGMEYGVREGYERLDELLARLSPGR